MRPTSPTFTIVIPTRDRPGPLAACLESLAALASPRDHFEVVVVDDASQTPLDRVIEPFRDRLHLTLHRQSHAGPSAARNAGAGLARGRFLAFTDDDCTPAPDWLSVLEARFDAADGEVLLGGHTQNFLQANPYSAASQLLVDFLYRYFQGRQGWFFTSNNLALPTHAFHAVGGFELRMTLAAAEDREFCCRWAQLGLPLVHVPEAVVFHAHFLDFRRYCKQHFNYGRGAYDFRQIMAERGGARVKIEPIRFYSSLVSCPFERSRTWRGVWLSLLLGVAQVVNAAGFVFERALSIGAGGLRRPQGA
jgi:glycosyltransferase involved in cell wall biosynthesis